MSGSLAPLGEEVQHLRLGSSADFILGGRCLGRYVLRSVHIQLRDGLRCHVRLAGRDGPAAVLVHGFGGSSGAWGEELLAHVAVRCRVFVVDLIGHGQSAKPHVPERYDVRALVDDLIELLDVLEIGTPTWIGYSMGGRLTLAAAALRPDRVTSLVLEGASPGLETEADRVSRRASDETLARLLEHEGIEAFADHWMALPIFASRRRLTIAQRNAIRRRLVANDPKALAACLRGFGRGAQPSFWSVLESIDVPVHLVVGEADTSSLKTAEQMDALLPRAKLTVVPGCGHTVYLDAPQAWLDVVTAHVTSSA